MELCSSPEKPRGRPARDPARSQDLLESDYLTLLERNAPCAADMFSRRDQRACKAADQCGVRHLRRPGAPLPGLKVRRAKRCASTSVAQPRVKTKARSVPIRRAAPRGDCESTNPGYGTGRYFAYLARSYD